MSVSAKTLPNPVNHCWWNKVEGMGLRSKLRCTLLCLHSPAASRLFQEETESKPCPCDSYVWSGVSCTMQFKSQSEFTMFAFFVKLRGQYHTWIW